MKITRSKKKAFTLTELLVVVVLAGVLAVTVLPKFNKMLESRKTTEAEDVMRAIRTEQELRCSLDKPYASSFSALSDLVASNDSTHYKYSLTSSGISAINKGTRDYFLSMPSYEDGRVCCSGSYCSSLNKDYPLCEDLVSRSDYKSGAACAVEEPSIPNPDTPGCTGESRHVCGCQGKGVQERECDPATGTWGGWSACSIDDCHECAGDAKRLCGCNNEGFQLRECDPLTGTWSAWGACSIEDCVSCTGESRRVCGCKGKGTQERECNTATGEWGEWLDCSVGECQECEGESERPCDCHGNVGDAIEYDVLDVKAGTQTRECDELTGTWGEWSACSVSPCLSCEGESTRFCDCHGNAVPGPAVPYKVGTQSRSCDSASGEWGPWGMCSIGECQESTCSWQEGTVEAFLQYSVGATCDTCERQLGQETCGACTKATEGNTCPSQVSACEPGCLDHQDRATPRAWNACVADGGTPVCIFVSHTPMCVCSASDTGSRE